MNLEDLIKEETARRYGMLQDDPNEVEAHVDVKTFTEIEVYPDHKSRKPSSLFKKNKKKLIKELDLGCWICGSKQDLEVHHWFEWSLFEALDPQKMLDVLQVLDVYGFAKQLGDTPLTTPDDIRNLVVLCKDHHRTPGLGIHTITFPFWIAQKVDKQPVTTSVEEYQKTEGKLKQWLMNVKQRFKRQRSS